MFRGSDADDFKVGYMIGCAHLVFVAFVIAFVLSKKEYEKRQPKLTRPPQGASAPRTPTDDEFAFPVDKPCDKHMHIWSPRNRVY